MKPEKTGYVAGSTPEVGSWNWAETFWLWPGLRVNWAGVRTTEAEALVRGTGPKAGEIDPAPIVNAVPAGTCLSVYEVEELPLFLTVKVCLFLKKIRTKKRKGKRKKKLTQA